MGPPADRVAYRVAAAAWRGALGQGMHRQQADHVARAALLGAWRGRRLYAANTLQRPQNMGMLQSSLLGSKPTPTTRATECYVDSLAKLHLILRLERGLEGAPGAGRRQVSSEETAARHAMESLRQHMPRHVRSTCCEHSICEPQVPQPPRAHLERSVCGHPPRGWCATGGGWA